MSWIEQINNIVLTIVTGDGQEYKPLWQEAKKNINFNTEGFDFIGVEGTFVERKEKQGTQFPILFYFTGDDHLEVASAFEISSRDKRPWKIKHPYYDDLTVQPLSLEFDNSLQNATKITGVLWQTIIQKYPTRITNPTKDIEIRKDASDEVIAATFVEDIETPDVQTIDSASNSVLQINKKYETLTSVSEDLQTLKDYTRSASAAAQELVSIPTRYIRETINLINFPFEIQQDISYKVTVLLSTILQLKETLLGNNSTDNNLILYETQNAVLFTELSRNIISSDENDFPTRASVLSSIDSVSTVYDDYLQTLDDNSIIQNQQIGLDLDYIVNLALAKLYDIAFNAKQERIFMLDKDDNIIRLAHRFNGPGQDAIDLFIEQNDISLDEYLGLKKGRKIVYYV